VKVLAWLIGFVALGGLIVLAVAGLSGATAILVTAVAIVAMIGLGNALGGRHTPNRTPYPVEGPTAASPGAGPGSGSGSGEAAETLREESDEDPGGQ
jgi:hypothetical protein